MRVKQTDRLSIKATKTKSLFHFAFTLAEVLIVMSIIGIIAEMTIPSLMQNVQIAQYKAGLKKAVDILNQAQLMIATDSGGNFAAALDSSCGSFTVSSIQSNDCVGNLFKDKLKYYKTCAAAVGGAYTNGCTPQYFYKYGSTTAIGDTSGWNNYGIVLKDGMSMLFYDESAAKCNNGSTNACTEIWLDVNGPNKKPNRMGDDMYRLFIRANNVGPMTLSESGGSDDCSSGGVGYYCGYKYLYVTP